jgi:hypothetical protein
MKRIINHIRNKPPEQKDRFIWISAGVVVAVLLIVWIMVGNSKKSDSDTGFMKSFTEKFNSPNNNLKTQEK